MGKLYKKLYKKMVNGGDYQKLSEEQEEKTANSQMISGTGANVAGAFGPIGKVVGGGLTLGNKMEKSGTAAGNVGSSILAPSAVGMIGYGANQIKDNGWRGAGNAVLNTASGGIFGKEQARKELKEAKKFQGIGEADIEGVDNYNLAKANGFEEFGIKDKEFYKYGGSLYKSMANGGKLETLSNENKEVIGRDHEEGGVKFPEAGVELEDGETINKNFVFSKELGFADKHKSIAKSIGKIEKKPENNLTRNSLSRLKEREELLKVEQEQLKETLGIDNEGMKRYGGELKDSTVTVTKASKRPSKYEDIKQKAEALAEEKKNTSHYNPEPYKSGVGTKKYANGGDIDEITSRGFGPQNMYGGLSREEYLAGYGASQMDLTPKETTNQAYGFDKPMTRVSTSNSSELPSTEESKGSKFNNIKGGLGNLTPYIDNAANFLLNRERAKEKIPQEKATKYLDAVNYDYAAQKDEANRQRLAFNKGIDQSNVSTGVANTTKAVGLAQSIRAKNNIQEAETNINAQEKARVSTINANIQSRNNTVDLNNKMRTLLAKDDIRREDSTNITNVAGDLMEADKDKRRESIIRDQNSLNLSTQDPKTVSIMMKSNREVFKKQGWTDKQIDDYIENAKGKEKPKSLNKSLKYKEYDLDSKLGVKVR